MNDISTHTSATSILSLDPKSTTTRSVSERRRSSRGHSFNSSFRSSRANSLSEISIDHKRRKKKKDKRFDCFHCNEEILAKKTNDGVFRKIYRPETQGFNIENPSRSYLVSAFVIISKDADIELEPVYNLTKDSINLTNTDQEGKNSVDSIKKNRRSSNNKLSRFKKNREKIHRVSDSEMAYDQSKSQR